LTCIRYATGCARRSVAGIDAMAMDQLFGLIAVLDAHFLADDVSEADADRWRALRRHVVRMRDGLLLVETTLRERRERKMPFTDAEARKLEGYVRWALDVEGKRA